MAKETLRCEWVKCGKKCRSCPHGPYWYAYWKEEGKLRKRYIGKGRPDGTGTGEDAQADAQAEPTPRPSRLDAIFNERTAPRGLAWEIMGISPFSSLEQLRNRYVSLCKELHPDRNPGCDDKAFRRVQCAFSFLRKILS